MTPGEKAFIDFCDKNNLKCLKIPETTTKTPDFILCLSEDCCVIVEIKDFDDNDNEKLAIENFKMEGCAVWDAGKRLTNKINSAKNQLKYCSGINMLLVYDNRSSIVRAFSEYLVSVAMYGIETREISNFGITMKHGANKKFTKENKTYFSYIGFLENQGCLNLYENYFAKQKLSAPTIKKLSYISLYRPRFSPNYAFCEWEKVNLSTS